jgi:hypothetical protein
MAQPDMKSTANIRGVCRFAAAALIHSPINLVGPLRPESRGSLSITRPGRVLTLQHDMIWQEI